MSSTQFRVLGPLEVERDGDADRDRSAEGAGAPPLSPPERQSRCSGRSDRRCPLGDEPPSSAAKLVQLYVSHLRNKLGREAIETVPSGYRMQVAPLALDCVRFEQLLREGRAAQTADNAQLAVAILTRALALWRGPALVDVSYDEFAAAEAVRLDELRLDCVEARLAALLALGENDEALAEAARLSVEYPHRERLRGVHMVALYRAGRQVEALEVFREARDEPSRRAGPRARRRPPSGRARDSSSRPCPRARVRVGRERRARDPDPTDVADRPREGATRPPRPRPPPGRPARDSRRRRRKR